MEILLWIFAALFVTSGAYITGYSLGKQNLRQDYKDNYKQVQNERDNYKHAKLAFTEETMEILKEAYSILSPIANQWEGRGTIPGQMFLSSLRSAVGPLKEEYKVFKTDPPQKYPDPAVEVIQDLAETISEQQDQILEKIKKELQTNSECEHDYMGTLNSDVKMCRRCPSKIRRKPWEIGDSFGENWKEDK